MIHKRKVIKTQCHQNTSSVKVSGKWFCPRLRVSSIRRTRNTLCTIFYVDPKFGVVGTNVRSKWDETWHLGGSEQRGEPETSLCLFLSKTRVPPKKKMNFEGFYRKFP